MNILTWIILLISVSVVLAAFFIVIRIANGTKKWSKALEGEIERLEKICQAISDGNTLEIVESEATVCPRGCPVFVCYAGGNDNCVYDPSRKESDR